MYNKNDPLVNSVKAIMEQNEHRRRVEAKLCEELGIYSRKQLPREHVANYDALLEQRLEEANKEKSDDKSKKSSAKLTSKDEQDEDVPNSLASYRDRIYQSRKKELRKEELVGNQHKIDANKNNRVDAHDFKLLRANKETMKEDAEQIDELSKKTLGSYVKKAASDMARQREKRVDTSGTRTDQDKAHNKEFNRKSGIRTAVDKLTREENRSSSDPDFAAPRDPRAPKYKDEIEYKEEPKATMPKNPPMPPRRPPNLEETSYKKLDEVSLDKMNAAKKEAEKRKGMAEKGTSPVDKKYAERYGKYVELAKRRMKSKMDEETLEEKATPAQQKKIEKVMGEFKKGELNSGSKEGPEVTSRKQAVAIALSQAGLSKKKMEEDFDLDAVMEEIRANIGEEAFAALMDEQTVRPDFEAGRQRQLQLGRNKAELQNRVTADLKANRPDLGIGSRYGLTQQGRDARAQSARNITRDDEDQEFMQTRQQAQTSTRRPTSQPAPATPAARPSAPQPADTVASSADRDAFRARTGSTVDSSTGQTQSNQPADTVASSADRDAFRARTGSTVGATQASSPATRPAAATARPTPSPAARPAAATQAPEPRSRQMFQAAQDRASSGENDSAAFFAADKQRTAELRGMQESKSLTSTINKILKG